MCIIWLRKNFIFTFAHNGFVLYLIALCEFLFYFCKHLGDSPLIVDWRVLENKFFLLLIFLRHDLFSISNLSDWMSLNTNVSGFLNAFFNYFIILTMYRLLRTFSAYFRRLSLCNTCHVTLITVFRKLFKIWKDRHFTLVNKGLSKRGIVSRGLSKQEVK